MRLEAITDTFRWSQANARAAEVKVLCDYIKANDVKLVVEIGTNNGFTAACMATTGVKVQTFDIESYPKVWNHAAFPYPELIDQIVFEMIGSPDCFTKVVMPEGPVLFFLDGDHSYEACFRDFAEVVKLSRPKDAIFIHDNLKIRGTRRFWAELVERFPGKTTDFPELKGLNGLGLFRP